MFYVGWRSLCDGFFRHFGITMWNEDDLKNIIIQNFLVLNNKKTNTFWLQGDFSNLFFYQMYEPEINNCLSSLEFTLGYAHLLTAVTEPTADISFKGVKTFHMHVCSLHSWAAITQ